MVNKQLVVQLLAEQKYDALIKIAAKYHKKVLRYIRLNLYHGYHNPLRWYAIEALGRLAKEFGSQKPEVYKNFLERLVLSMDQESGNVPWGSPEAMASIISSQPHLFGNFTSLLITNSLANPMCHQGLIWAISRIARVAPYLICSLPVEIKNHLHL